MKKTVLIFSVPFSGHLNVLKSFISRHDDDFAFHLIVVGWANIPPEPNGLPIRTHILTNGELHETDPAYWTLPRAAQLFPKALEIAKEINPDIILYDQFAIEGALVAKSLNLPAWCSIPAMIGPHTAQTYLANKLAQPTNQTALKNIKNILSATGIDLEQELEVISDGLHYPGDVNIVWSYRDLTPTDFLKHRHDRPYLFVGNPRGQISSSNTSQNKRILISLGTVVMNNLWNNDAEVQNQLKAVFAKLSQHWNNDGHEITFVTQGKHVLDSYPANWNVVDTIDQPTTLAHTDLFITHAGSNSFHEAVMSHVPMVAIPFFGDQPLIASQIEKLGFGINLGQGNNIDTRQSRTFLNNDLASRIEEATHRILNNTQPYETAFNTISLGKTDLATLLQGKIPFIEGDLLYGTNIARKHYVDQTHSQDEFRILEFKPFSQLARHPEALPRIVDIYHDVIRDPELIEQELACPLYPYADILKRYKHFLDGEDDICTMCLKGIEFFTQLYHVHFILEDYDPRVNVITNKEVEYILSHWDRLSQKVTFYKREAGAWLPLTKDQVIDIQNA